MATILIQDRDGARVTFSQREAHHLVTVRRYRENDSFVALTEEGERLRCVLKRDGANWYGEVLEALSSSSESAVEVTLALALIKKDHFEWAIRKATELGADSIYPLVTSRTEIKLDVKRSSKKVERWKKILVESVKQCGRRTIPRIHGPVDLQLFLSSTPIPHRIALDVHGNTSLRSYLNDKAGASSILVLVGPEGGWGSKDLSIFEEHGVQRIRLGPRILRAETAPLSILSILQYELGDLQQASD